MNLLIYGLGKGQAECESAIKKEHCVMGYTDSFSEIEEYNGKPFWKIENVSNLKFDYIIVSVFDLEAVKKICHMLVDCYKIPPDKIIVYWYVHNHEIWKYKLEKYELHNIETIIVGNSHAVFGFLEQDMRMPSLNVAAPGGDIFYSSNVLHECFTKYGDRLLSVKNVIIDLYDYHVFNTDVSKGPYYAAYLFYGGGMLKCHQRSYTEFLYICRESLNQKVINSVFEIKNSIIGTELHENERWNHITPDAALPKEIAAGVFTRRYESTIRENITMLERALGEIRKLRPNINIIFTLIPRYISVELKEMEVGGEWKIQFEEKIKFFCCQYKTNYWNYKKREEISGNQYFYNDVCHLNTVGGKAMTAVLNKDLEMLD